MLEKEDILLGYQLFFHREPESDVALHYHLAHSTTLKKFYLQLVNSEEFQAQISTASQHKLVNFCLNKVKMYIFIWTCLKARWLRKIAIFYKRLLGQNILSETDIQEAYQIFLKQPIQTEHEIRYYLQTNTTPKEFYFALLAKREYELRKKDRTFFDKMSRPNEIESSVTSQQEYQTLFEHTQQTWSQLGAVQPYWSVLSHEKYRNDKIEQAKKEFYASGQLRVNLLCATLQRNHVITQLNETKKMDILELGCGLGRVTYFLAQHFSKVIAVDISKQHLNLAQQHVFLQNVSFRLITQSDDYNKLPEYDLFFSEISLQHSPPPLIAYILDCCFALLKDNGLAYFQIPTWQNGYTYNTADYLQHKQGEQEYAMHCLPMSVVFAIAHKHHLVPIEVLEDNLAGNNLKSNTFLLRKQAVSAN